MPHKFAPDVRKHADMRKGLKNKPIERVEYSFTQEKQLRLKLSNNF